MKKTLLLLGTALMLIAACKPAEIPNESSLVRVSNQDFYAEGGTFNVLVNANIALDVEIDADWVTCTSNPTKADAAKASAGASNKALEFSVDAWDAKGDKKRTANVRIFGNGVEDITFSVSQVTGQFFKLLSIDPTGGEIPSEGGILTVSINTNVAYSTKIEKADESAFEIDEWLTADENNSDKGSIARFNIQPNETFQTRAAKITFTAEEFEDIVVEVNQLSQIRGITSASALMAFAEEWNKNKANGDYSKWLNEEGTAIILANDIDMSEVTDWTPIGCFATGGKIEMTNVKMSYSNCQTFLNKTFDGQGFALKNWHINISKDEIDANGLMFGLFGVGSGATIKNLVIDSSCTLNVDIKNVKGSVSIAPVIACCNNCIVENVTSNIQIQNAKVETSLSTSPLVIISGIVGYFKTNNQNRTKWVKNCMFGGNASNVSTSTIYSSSTPSVLAGVVGWVFGQTKGASEAVIENCTNNGKLSAQFLRVAGVVGTSSQDAIYKNCVNNGTIELTSFEGCTITTCYAGGVVAFESCQVADSYPEMNDCVNNGTVVGYGKLVTVGGMAGCTKNASLKNCSNTGLVVLTSDEEVRYHGLLVGCLNPTTSSDRPQPKYTNITIGGRYARGYSNGTVSEETTVTEENYFELAAFEKSAWATNSYWNKTNVTFLK